MSQESRVPRIHIKKRVEPSSQNEPSSAHNEPESSETSKRSVDISSLREKYNIRLPRSYKEQSSAPQTVHFSEELESAIPETVDELKTGKCLYLFYLLHCFRNGLCFTKYASRFYLIFRKSKIKRGNCQTQKAKFSNEN